MEKATVRDLVVANVEHVGYSDGSGVSLEGTAPDRSSFIQQVDAVCRTINDVGLSSGRIGLEKSSNFFQLGVAEGIIAGIPNAKWSDCSGLVEECREVQSPLEIECTRAAAKISDDMMRSAIDAAGPGVAMADIVANVYATMIQGGGTLPPPQALFPSFGPPKRWNTNTEPGTKASSRQVRFCFLKCRAVFAGTTHLLDALSTLATRLREQQAYSRLVVTRSRQ